MPGAAKTLFITQELLPFHATGGMAVLSRDLPEALCGRGWPHSFLLPLIKGITQVPQECCCEPVAVRSLAIGGADFTYQIFAVTRPGVAGEVFLVAQDTIFAGRIYDDTHRLHRNLIIGDAAQALLEQGNQRYGFVHALDQLSALSLACIRVAAGQRYGLIFNILSAEYDFPLGSMIGQSDFERRAALQDMFGPALTDMSAIELGMAVADRTITSSPAYADLLAEKYRLEDPAARAGLVGIAQGIDTAVWDPLACGRRFTPIRSASIKDDKRQNRRMLSAALTALPRFSDWSPGPVAVQYAAPPDGSGQPLLLSFIGRFCRAKGRAALYALLDQLDRFPGVELVFLIPEGSVTEVDLQKLRLRVEREPRLRVINHYDQAFAELVFASSDYVLMPSEQEPGGLCQKMAMRFGALPLVTPAGGLKSSVIDVFANPGSGTGFVAAAIEPESYLELLGRVLALDPADPQLLTARLRAMATDHSWTPTIGAYEAVYAALAR